MSRVAPTLRTGHPGTGIERKENAAAAGIRYVVAAGGRTVQASPHEQCSNVGCVFVWERDSTLWAEILDVQVGESVALVSAAVSGRPFVSFIYFIPAGAPSFTETWACRKLKQGVVDVLTAHGDRKP